jgi:signal transduction histidine kinase
VIDAQELPLIFNRFFRGKTGLASGEAGTGLGLAISKEIVEHHGGWIDVTSRDGAGTIFTVWLPRAGSRRAQKLREAGTSP